MVSVVFLAAVNASVDSAMIKTGMAMTIENRIKVLNGMHSKILHEGITNDDRLILQVIEDEIVRLNDSLP